jgi:pimeloyl-ACP methyl ester carboxylesterase
VTCRALALASLLGLLAASPGCALKYQASAMDYRDESMPVVELLGADIRYDDRGPADADTVLLIHGFGSSLASWDFQVHALAERFRVVRLDLKGFGRSSKYDGGYGPEDQADIVLALLDHLGIERAHLVAHSYGSVVALAVALREPDRVDRVVLTGAFVYPEQVPWSLRSARTPGMGELIFGAWYAENLEWRFGLSFHDPDRWISEDMLWRAKVTLSQPGARATALATVRAMELEVWQQRYGEIESPALLLIGREDGVARPEFGERLAVQLRRGRVVVLPYCGHFPMIEQAQRFNALVLDHLLEEGR